MSTAQLKLECSDVQTDTFQMKHTCEFCSSDFDTELCHRRHIWMRTACLMCCICRLRLATGKDLHHHEKFHSKCSGQKWQMCPHCPFRTRQVSVLDVHILRLHTGPEMNACNYSRDTDKKDPEEIGFEDVISSCSEQEVRMLPMQLQGSEDAMNSHSELQGRMSRMQLQDDRMPCAEQECNSSTSELPQGESDVRTNPCKSKHICEFCGSGFTTELYHTHHVSRRTSHLMCCICKVRFATERDLGCHEKFHRSRQGRMRCPHCPFKTLCTNLLDGHIVRRHGRDSSCEGSEHDQNRNCLKDAEGKDENEIDGNQKSDGEFQCSLCSATDTS